MWLMLILWFGVAYAGVESQTFIWDLKVENQRVGSRKLVLKDMEGKYKRRVIESWTEINAQNLGSQFTFQQRLTGHIMGGPASFHAVIEASGRPREIQGRRSGLGWQVSVVEKGRARSWELAADQVDLSSVDLFNPDSPVHLTRLSHARILSAETGAILEGKLTPLGASRIYIDGEPVVVRGFQLKSESTDASFFFDSEGVLVRYQTFLVGLSLSGTLRTPPPRGRDHFKVYVGSQRVTETDIL